MAPVSPPTSSDEDSDASADDDVEAVAKRQVTQPLMSSGDSGSSDIGAMSDVRLDDEVKVVIAEGTTKGSDTREVTPADQIEIGELAASEVKIFPFEDEARPSVDVNTISTVEEAGGYLGQC